MPNHILVPIDDSDRSTKALRYALDQFPDSKLTVLHALNPADGAIYTGGEMSVPLRLEETREQHERRAEVLLEDARDTASEYGREIDTATRTGRPARAIVEYAGEEGVDLIVIGSHGRSGVARVLLGSVAETVVRRAPVPVLVVR